MKPEEIHDPEVFLRSVRGAIERLRLTDRGVLVAVSGGADSLALLLSLHRLGVLLEVATIDHRLRPTSASEVEQVRQLCARLSVRFHTRVITLTERTGLEAAARDARYAALQAVRLERGLAFIATGHTASDQAETVLMRLGRGSALGGAAGVLERRPDGVVRPLLGVTREQTRAFVAFLGETPVDDPMNLDPTFTRVQVRQAVLPALRAALGPGVDRALTRFAQLALEDDALLQGLARTGLARALRSDGTIDRVALLALERPVARRVIAAVLEASAVPIDATLIDECLIAVERQTTATLPLDLLLTTREGGVAVEPAPARQPIR
jgi:tRNA(Ile)-lysidine synthase